MLGKLAQLKLTSHGNSDNSNMEPRTKGWGLLTRMKLDRLQRLVSICDPRLIDETSSISVFLKENEQLKTTDKRIGK